MKLYKRNIKIKTICRPVPEVTSRPKNNLETLEILISFDYVDDPSFTKDEIENSVWKQIPDSIEIKRKKDKIKILEERIEKLEAIIKKETTINECLWQIISKRKI